MCVDIFNAFYESALKKFLSQFYLALHSYGQKVIYPWSYTEKKVADWKQLQKMGEVMARAIHKKSDGGVQYTVRSYNMLHARARDISINTCA